MSPTTTEALLRASIELLQLRKQIEDLTEANERLRAQVNRREFDLSCDGPFFPPPFQRQGE